MFQGGMYVISWFALMFFVLFYWQKQIWPAIKGFNGKIQKEELLNLAGVGGIMIYIIEIIFGKTTFELEFGLFMLLIVVVARGTKISISDIFNKFANLKNKESG